MSDSISDQSRVRQTVLDSYLTYYSSVWAPGNGKVCRDPQVREDARQVLQAAADPAERFLALDFYATVAQCARHTGTHLAHCLASFSKVAEMLETLCVNLFLFPWKKEIKTLKTFTGHFVYFIQPVLPHDTTKSILQSIGYCLENDTEYKMSNHVDLDKVKELGFDLFLARLECEYLLEVMGEKSHAECLEILSSRASPQRPGAGEALDPMGCAEGRPPRSIVIDDTSILEMQKSYPDLAFRQKPIFTKPQTAQRNKERTKDPTPAQLHTVGIDMSGPQSIALHTESPTMFRKLQLPESVVEAQSTEEKQPRVLCVGSVHHRPGFSQAGATDVLELTERLCNVQVKDFGADEPLKYPTEETSQAQQCQGGVDCAVSPLCASTEEKQAVPCTPSQDPSCRPAAEMPQNDPIKEPPHSFYIPNCLSGCSPAVALPTDQQAELQPTELWSHCL
ncbi:spermatogenesis-associated protein 2 [Electrophorus electricus]|uniref:Spermatogenesis-associated protein 2 PUB-like domain-containing protein n=1 Tax=Electrophorus electricus TaxID=8005 RepID=A0A4W4H4Y7_ELEEL|nr:spermatogenesis-associated protein 2 [Electrophorus electricus]XP_026883425.2 spermatogenesis-associated protein 2 [Electrophorus electricus]